MLEDFFPWAFGTHWIHLQFLTHPQWRFALCSAEAEPRNRNREPCFKVICTYIFDIFKERFIKVIYFQIYHVSTEKEVGEKVAWNQKFTVQIVLQFKTRMQSNTVCKQKAQIIRAVGSEHLLLALQKKWNLIWVKLKGWDFGYID